MATFKNAKLQFDNLEIYVIVRIITPDLSLRKFKESAASG